MGEEGGWACGHMDKAPRDPLNTCMRGVGNATVLLVLNDATGMVWHERYQDLTAVARHIALKQEA